MKHWLKTTLRLLVLGSFALIVVTCTDSSAPFDIGSPLFQVADGTQEGGNEDVFFLPPLVSNPVGHPKFGDRPLNPDLEGAVFARICETDGTSCVDDPPPWVAELSMTLNGNHYQAVWNAKGVPANVDYRINIFIGNLNIAHRDVDLGKGGSCTTDDDVCTVKKNVPIKVRIESFAACIASDPDFDPDDPDATCATAFLDPGDYLALPDAEDKTIGVALLSTGSAAINMQTCPDLRDRDARRTIDDGLIDLPTFGDCVVIDALSDETNLYGTTTLCNAFQAGLDAGLSEEQMGRATVHRFSTDPDVEGTYALPHAEFQDVCDSPGPVNGRVIEEFTGAERFALLLRRTWWTIADHVRAWAEPAPLWAGPPLPCHRGCSSSGGFRSDYDAALSAGIDFHPDPVFDEGPFVRDFGDRLIGDVLQDVSVRAWDSGDCDDAGCIPDTVPVNNVRLTISVAGNAMVRPYNSTDPDDFVSTLTVYTGTDGIVSFDILVGPGESTVYAAGIGVGLGKGSVQAPEMDGADEYGPLTEEALEFTVEGFYYTIQQLGVGEEDDGPVVGVVPISNDGQTVQDFYNYGAEGAEASSTTAFGLEQTDISVLFLFEGHEEGEEDGDDVVSLVMIHDKRAPDGDGSGGTATFNYDGIPDGAVYVVRDDEAEPLPEESDLNTTPSVWSWNEFNTDGGAISPLGTGFEIELTPLFPLEGGLSPGYIKEWKFLSGDDGTDVIDLDMTKVIKVRGAG